MITNQKKVSRLPAEEVWAGNRLVSTIKVRDLNAFDLVDLLRSGAVRFVVAEVGRNDYSFIQGPLSWAASRFEGAS